MTKLQLLTGRIPDPYMLPTPSYGLNRALGGGLLSGRIHVLWGPRASSKTTLALHMVAEAQKLGKQCLWVDAEKTYKTDWAEKCGVQVDELALIKQGANIAEELLQLVVPKLDKEEVDVVVIDSLSSVVLASFFEKPETNAIGIFSRSAKFVLIKLLNSLGADTQIILVSHASLDLSGYHPITTAAIGNATGHWASTIIALKQGNSKDKDFREDGSRRITWKIEKSKQSTYPKDGYFWFNPEQVSFDMLSEIMETALELELIEQKGAWFYYASAKFQGKNGVLDALNTDLLFRDSLLQQIGALNA